MDFGFDLISADEYERQRDLYGPLTDALRRLIDAGIRTAVDEDTVREAQAAIEAVTAILERAQRSATSTLPSAHSRLRRVACPISRCAAPPGTMAGSET
ncbi:hypothetical protein ACVWWN_004119 [Mycobacterium sp. URHB0021]